ncbi:MULTISPECIES: tetratricopeptide repeat protein [Cupriavidus]
MKDSKQIDWETLQFTCTVEQFPPVDPEADVWFKQARALEKLDQQANDAEMLRLYQQAAERGHYKAINNLAILYSEGMGAPRNESKAVDLIERLMKMNVAQGYYQMGVFLEQGIGVRKDKIAAQSYFRKAADMGNRYGQWAVGEELLGLFARQPEPARSRGKAIGKQMLECALSQDLAEAAHALGMEYLIADKDTPSALLYFQKAAALGYNDSLYKLYALFDEGKHGLAKDPKRAACYDRLWEQLQAEPGKRFPDIDHLCPLPPPPARTGASGQAAPRVGQWHQLGNPAVMFRAAPGDTLPQVQGAAVQWEWEAAAFMGSIVASGQPCPWPGYWACQELPTGERWFAHHERFPEVEGRPVTWRLMRG